MYRGAKLVRESLLEFHQTGDPIKLLGIGPYEAYINAFFDNLKVSRDKYRIEGGKTIFSGDLYLDGCASLTKLPDGLTVGGGLYLTGCTRLTKLPDGLTVGGWLSLEGCTSLTELPDNLKVNGDIWVKPNQKELIDYIKHSKYKNKLEIG